MNNKTKNIIGWILTALLGLSFIMAGFSKVSAQEAMIQSFNEYGLPIALMYFIGISEILGAIGLFIRKTRVLAAIGLIMVMLGALATHFISGQSILTPLVHFIVLSVFIFIRKEEIPFIK